jgi:hypothetical protein
LYEIRDNSTEDSYTTVAFFLSREEVGMISKGLQRFAIHVFLHGFYFLKADDICWIRAKPICEAFVHGTTYTIDIVGYDAHPAKVGYNDRCLIGLIEKWFCDVIPSID